MRFSPSPLRRSGGVETGFSCLRSFMKLAHPIGFDELQQQLDDGIDFTALLGIADLAGMLVAAEPWSFSE